MPELIDAPVRVEAAGEPPKLIDEFAGRASGGEERVSIARMRSPAGWSEPGQRPEFDEYTVVLGGALRVESEDGRLDVAAGQGVLVRAGEWVRYSTPEGAEYLAVCLPAFSPETVHRDERLSLSRLSAIARDQLERGPPALGRARTTRSCGPARRASASACTVVAREVEAEQRVDHAESARRPRLAAAQRQEAEVRRAGGARRPHDRAPSSRAPARLARVDGVHRVDDGHARACRPRRRRDGMSARAAESGRACR